MFEAHVYRQRRRRLRKLLKTGLIVLPGNGELPMNYAANAYPFRQDSTFLYFFGLDTPGLNAILDADEGRDVVYGDDIGLEDIIWMGHLPRLKERARAAGVTETAPAARYEDAVKRALSRGRKVHFLPPYHPEVRDSLSRLLGLPPEELKAGASEDLIKAVVGLRIIKSPAEVREIEAALGVTARMYREAMKTTRPGVPESEVAGRLAGLAIGGGRGTAFPTILTVNGQILHNHDHSHVMRRGRMVVIDSGAESKSHYAADITRTLPVSGTFTTRQREIYEIVLDAQKTAIASMKPGVLYRDVHLKASRVIASGLKEMGLMKGDVDEAVAAGAHALFFPHGLGHQLGLDVHDMENLGENFVGYDDQVKRSTQFGLAYLRFARELRPGHILTVEPGIYFIPALAAKWKKEKQHPSFINFLKVRNYLDFGGIRIEDDVLITASGRRVLGPPIPKTVRDVEKTMAR
ncbi:MAG: aminopeptidase P family protein [Candidatus Aminicenantes bacterium]|nr:aminopeptidase P family protein [Candidatus Aminicenantes bacterium]